jgi:hypothetical protein
LVRYVDLLRRNYYLDGPNDVDWLFRNEIMAEREERLYVDYVETDDGDMWISPRRYDGIGPRYASGAVELVGALSRAGMSNARAFRWWPRSGATSSPCHIRTGKRTSS